MNNKLLYLTVGFLYYAELGFLEKSGRATLEHFYIPINLQRVMNLERVIRPI